MLELIHRLVGPLGPGALRGPGLTETTQNGVRVFFRATKSREKTPETTKKLVALAATTQYDVSGVFGGASHLQKHPLTSYKVSKDI